MSTNLAGLTDDQTELLAPLSPDSGPTTPQYGGTVVAATPAALAGAGVAVAAAAADGQYDVG